jgi:RNA polymerase sigma factor (TIGR02999 family)
MTLSSLIASAEAGEAGAADALFTALYSELHGMARLKLARLGGGLSLGVTTLLHETYLDISQREGTVFPDRGHFMAYAARVMRALIMDYARKRRTQKHGGGFHITSIENDVVDPATNEQELARIGAALEELGALDASLAQVVDLKFFCGFSFAEIAAMRGVTERTIQRHWEKARTYLHRVLRESSLG